MKPSAARKMLRQEFRAHAKHGARPRFSLRPSRVHGLGKAAGEEVWEGRWVRLEAPEAENRTAKSLGKHKS